MTNIELALDNIITASQSTQNHIENLINTPALIEKAARDNANWLCYTKKQRAIDGDLCESTYIQHLKSYSLLCLNSDETVDDFVADELIKYVPSFLTTTYHYADRYSFGSHFEYAMACMSVDQLAHYHLSSTLKKTSYTIKHRELQNALAALEEITTAAHDLKEQSKDFTLSNDDQALIKDWSESYSEYLQECCEQYHEYNDLSFYRATFNIMSSDITMAHQRKQGCLSHHEKNTTQPSLDPFVLIEKILKPAIF